MTTLLSSQLDVHDTEPLNAVQNVIESRRLVDEFESSDSYHNTFPAWVFLIDNIVKTYGNCPYLPHDKAHLRHEHIKMNPSIYEDAMSRYVNKTIYNGFEAEQKTARQTLTEVVHDEIGNVFIGADPQRILDGILSEAHWFQNQKSRTKTVTERWQRTLKDIDTVYEKTGVNLALYLKAIHGVSIKYKASAPVSGSIASTSKGTFESAYESYARSMTSLETEETHIARVREDVIQKLAKLIRNGFKESQTSKYKKRWNLLTDAQQLERIQSFSNYFCLLNNDTKNQSGTLVSAIMDRLSNKKLKTSDIKWVIKEGIIKEIQTLGWEDGTFVFSEAKPKPKPKKTASASNDTLTPTQRIQLSDADIVRLHRLIIHCMTLPYGQSRDNLIGRIVTLFTRHSVLRSVARDYVSGVLDNIIALTSSVEM